VLTNPLLLLTTEFDFEAVDFDVFAVGCVGNTFVFHSTLEIGCLQGKAPCLVEVYRCLRSTFIHGIVGWAMGGVLPKRNDSVD
jgi:hypothetical protein